MESSEWTSTNICETLLTKKITSLNDITESLQKL